MSCGFSITAPRWSSSRPCARSCASTALARKPCGAGGLIMGTVPEGVTPLVQACGSVPPTTTESNHDTSHELAKKLVACASIEFRW